ncbi:MAG: anthranilate phosphoribosyltransferase [Thaumarchaeota archaeon]|nr:anthranilate phosphoribosyltransferase [Nitrososphaerota archaeon]
MIRRALQRLLDGQELANGEIEGSVREIAEGKATQALMGAFLVALRLKGETPREVATFASTLREYSVLIAPSVSGKLVDTCGTGGDRVKTFNVSTLSALVASGAGASVAKHGNRSVTSRCGSADLLERLGFNLNATPEVVKQSIENVGIGFMFAPVFHPAMKHVASVRKELGVRTIFNLMGPLLNPASANAQVVGVYEAALVEKVAEVLRMMGVEEAMVVHGLEGMDEISLSGKTLVAQLKGGEVKTCEYSPADFGMEKVQTTGGEVEGIEEGARVALQVLDGHSLETVMTKMVVVNSAAALVVVGRADDFAEAVGQAEESLASGSAMRKLKELVKHSGGDASRVEVIAKNR